MQQQFEQEVKPNYSLNRFVQNIRSIDDKYSFKIKKSLINDRTLFISYNNAELSGPFDKQFVAENQKLVNYLTFFKENYNIVDKHGKHIALSL